MRLCIDGNWYDLEKWAPFHPGGAEIMQHFDGHDATDHFYSLHSKEAIERLQNMRPVDVKEPAPQPTKFDIAYRELKQKLVNEGFYERSVLRELSVLLPIVSMVVWGTLYAWTYPVLSAILIGVAMQQAGWLGHDMTHARNSAYCDFMLRYVSGWINGFDRWWWSNKHNTHHVLTNHVGIDPDIDNRPFLFLWAPPKSLDHHFRRYQHYYFLPLYSFLYVSWRMQSIQYAWAHKSYRTLLLSILPSYIWLAYLPLAVSVGSVLVGGFLVAMVVTLSHESEEMLTRRETSYVKNQFESTKDIICNDPITEYLFGGMQYQLEHHLFPTLPRYYHSYTRPIVQAFAKEVGLEYKGASVWEMLKQHYATLKANALVTAKEE